MLFVEAKWLRNDIIASGNIFRYKDTGINTVQGFDKDGNKVEHELKYLGSHQKQSLIASVQANIKALSSLKKKGRKLGKLKFKSDHTIIDLKQRNVTYKFNNSMSKVKIQGIPKEIRVNGGHQLKDLDYSNAKLVKKATGYYLKVSCFKDKELPYTITSNTKKLGIDMGIKDNFTLSDGTIVNTVVEETEQLKRLRKRKAKQVKGSNNSRKTQLHINRKTEKLTNTKNDEANQLVADWYRDYNVVYFQDENLNDWKSSKRKDWSRRVHHTIMDRVKTILIHKTKQGKAVMVDRFTPTTQYCPKCSALNKHALDKRLYVCACSYRMGRDKHNAVNMIIMGDMQLSDQKRAKAKTTKHRSKNNRVSTTGTVESNAHGEVTKPIAA